MTKSCSSEAMYSSANRIMTLEQSHCQATKRPNRVFVDARYLWVDGLMYILDSGFQPTKLPKRVSVNTR
jgi:hypothetical protein